MADEKSTKSLRHAHRTFCRFPVRPNQETEEYDKSDQVEIDKHKQDGTTTTTTTDGTHPDAKFPKFGSKFVDDELNVEPQILLNYIEQNIIGSDKVFAGPFGLTKGGYSLFN